ncbi:hypothetical protein Ais01nite_18090 [Asanoa ishikariensis]|uniref:HEAT repeat-containing protein n=1 Tax=Asanoa ishikariensis TaxID=137265 RepID=A0A1H3UDM6_9ACTN|nr:hypothetical protein Ais01nite_18090 [Asanoa ishikariensis]SDZ60543.1 hypothetical protein SAMN05421684_7064 [Asanoa ishikariensis]
MLCDVTIDQPWFMGSWIGVLDRPEEVDEAVDRNDPYAGVALLTLVLHRPDPEVALPRIKRALVSPNAQTRANALQSLGHYARLHRSIDADLVRRLRCALSDRTPVGRSQIRGYAYHAACDVGMFARRHELPRWLRRRCAGPRRPTHQ